MVAGLPGQSAALSNTESNIFWGGTNSQIGVLRRSAVIVSTATDAGNTPTTVLRPGLILGTVDSTGVLTDYRADGTTGIQNIAGVLEHEVDTLDEFATAQNIASRVVSRAPLRAESLLIEGVALVGHTDEFVTRRRLGELGCVMNDDVNNFLSGINERLSVKVTDYTVLKTDNGTTFVSKTADCEYTLPTILPGLKYTFLMTANFELKVTSVAGDDMIIGNDMSADSVVFTTNVEQIGAWITVRCEYVDTTLKWIVLLPQAPFGTAAGSEMTIGVTT